MNTNYLPPKKKHKQNWKNYKENRMDKELLEELIDAVVVAIDLLGIDVKKAYPKLWEEFKGE